MSAGINARVIPGEEAMKLHPLLVRDKLLGALYVPDDGIARAILADEVMGERSISRGARFIADCEVIAIDQSDGHVTGVQTTLGSFPADIVVSCAGIWGPKIGAMVGMSKAIQPLAHQLCYTTPMPELASYKGEAELPVLRHQGSDLYFRQRGQSLAVGWYGHRPLPVRAKDILPCDLAEVMPSQMPFTPEEWKGAMERATEVIPALRGSEIVESMNGLFSFTVDNFPLMGEWSGLKGFWVAEAVWITHACGVARAIAEWIVNGHPALAVHECDVNRFDTHQLGSLHIEERGAQNYVEVYDLLHPLQPMESPYAPLVSTSVSRNSVASSSKLPAMSDRNGTKPTQACSPATIVRCGMNGVQNSGRRSSVQRPPRSGKVSAFLISRLLNASRSPAMAHWSFSSD
jgi:glycine/D-amino acid oxidase-like deaminating enzyme